MRLRSLLTARPHRCPQCGGDLTRSRLSGCCIIHRLLVMPAEANDRKIRECAA